MSRRGAPITLYAAAPESVPVIRCSPPSWAAQIALMEEGLPHEVRWLRFDCGEHRSEAMRAIHPAGTVPVLVDGDTVLVDTVEILEHIARRRLVATAARREAARAVKDAGMLAFRTLMTDESAEPWAPLVRALDAFEEHAPGELDIASLLVVVYSETARSLGLATDPWPALEALLARSRLRPSLQASWPSTWGAP